MEYGSVGWKVEWDSRRTGSGWVVGERSSAEWRCTASEGRREQLGGAGQRAIVFCMN
jgi:hypothetical protein